MKAYIFFIMIINVVASTSHALTCAEYGARGRKLEQIMYREWDLERSARDIHTALLHKQRYDHARDQHSALYEKFYYQCIQKKKKK